MSPRAPELRRATDAGTDIEDTAAQLRALLATLLRQQREPAAQQGLTPSRLTVLALLAEHPPMRMGDLARHLGTTAASTSRMVDVLVDLDLLARVDDPGDQRACLVQLTSTGASRLAEVRRDGLERLVDAIEELTPDHRAALLAARPALEDLTGRLVGTQPV